MYLCTDANTFLDINLLHFIIGYKHLSQFSLGLKAKITLLI